MKIKSLHLMLSALAFVPAIASAQISDPAVIPTDTLNVVRQIPLVPAQQVQKDDTDDFFKENANTRSVRQETGTVAASRKQITDKKGNVVDLTKIQEVAIDGDVNVVFCQNVNAEVFFDGSAECEKYVEIKPSGKKLEVKAKRNLRKQSYNGKLVFVYMSLPAVEKIKIKGSGDFLIQDDISSKKLDIVSEKDASIKAVRAISTDKLELELRGSNDANFTKISVKSFDCKIKGSGNVIVSGQADNVDLVTDGSGSIDARRLSVKSGDAKVKSSGSIAVSARKLSSEISGSGKISISAN